MVHRYVPILRWKRGEKVAVKHLSHAGRGDVAPLFLLGTDQYVAKKATKTKGPVVAADVVAEEAGDIWGAAPFFIDAAALTPAAGGHPLVAIAASCNTKGLKLIPATTLAAPPAYATAVAAVVASDNRGVALRVDMAEFASAATWAASWKFAPSVTDLILDCEDTINAASSLGAALHPAFLSLHNGAKWRSVTLCGTSMPENFVGYAAGNYSIQRVELTLWTALSKLALPYRLDFGDYATVPVVPPPSGIRWGFPINVKYTLKNDFFICRGVGTTGVGGVDPDIQLIKHAKAIVANPGRGRLAHCWADDRIDAIASGAESPEALEHWVRIGVNRHIEVTRHHLP